MQPVAGNLEEQSFLRANLGIPLKLPARKIGILRPIFRRPAWAHRPSALRNSGKGNTSTKNQKEENPRGSSLLFDDAAWPRSRERYTKQRGG